MTHFVTQIQYTGSTATKEINNCSVGRGNMMKMRLRLIEYSMYIYIYSGTLWLKCFHMQWKNSLPFSPTFTSQNIKNVRKCLSPKCSSSVHTITARTISLMTSVSMAPLSDSASPRIHSGLVSLTLLCLYTSMYMMTCTRQWQALS